MTHSEDHNERNLIGLEPEPFTTGELLIILGAIVFGLCALIGIGVFALFGLVGT